MELGYMVAVPASVLTDNVLTPTEKAVLALLYGYTLASGYNRVSNRQLATDLRYKEDGKIKQLSDDYIQRVLDKLTEHGYIAQHDADAERKIVINLTNKEVTVKVMASKPPLKKIVNAEGAKEVLEYLSASAILRGYRKVAFKPTKASLEPIQARLNDGYTVEQCISVINIKFEDSYFKNNPKYLVSQTLFRPTNFERYLTETSSVKGIENKVVTKFGLAPKTSATSSEPIGEEVTF